MRKMQCSQALGSPTWPNSKTREQWEINNHFTNFFSAYFYWDFLFYCCGPISSTSASALVYQLAVTYLPCKGNAGHDVTVLIPHLKLKNKSIGRKLPFWSFYWPQPLQGGGEVITGVGCLCSPDNTRCCRKDPEKPGRIV